MQCLSCQYDLSHLTLGESAGGELGVHRCPECGRIFDANDPQTFAKARTRFTWLTALFILITATSPIWVVFLVLWLTGRL